MYFNARTIARITGLIMTITGIAMLPAFLCALYYGETASAHGLLLSCIISVLPGAAIYHATKTSRKELYTRDGYLAVIVCWLICSLLGALPYFISGEITSYADAFFESTSGYTTTGATVMSEASLTRSLLMWKAVTHWLGGMGILVFVISVLPALGTGGHRIAVAEAPWPSFTKLAPRISDIAKMLYFIYIFFTVLEFLLLSLSSMSHYDALINSLGSVSTAGLHLHSQGIAYYKSLYVEIIITVFTIMSSINYLMYIYILKGDMSHLKKNVELKVFLSIIAASSLVMALSLRSAGTYDSFAEALRHSVFQAASTATTSGYILDSYAAWPAFCQALLFILLLIGGCAASTCGSIKVIRIVIMIKLIMRGFVKRLHPHAVRAVKVGDSTISANMVSSVTAFIFLYAVVFIFSSLILAFQNLDMETTLGSVAALMSNTGTGFGDVSGGNFSMYSAPLKIYMSLLMMTGRLELFAVLLLFIPSFWNPNRSRNQ